jgi:hypothetical protein
MVIFLYKGRVKSRKWANQHITSVLGSVQDWVTSCWDFQTTKTIWSNHLASDIQMICYKLWTRFLWYLAGHHQKLHVHNSVLRENDQKTGVIKVHSSKVCPRIVRVSYFTMTMSWMQSISVNLGWLSWTFLLKENSREEWSNEQYYVRHAWSWRYFNKEWD